MYIFVVIVLFVWMILLQDEVRSLKEKLQKYINESYVSQVKSPVPPEKKLDEMQVETFKANQEPIKEKTPENLPQEEPQEEPDKIPAAAILQNKKEPGKGSGFEKIFLGNIFNKIGALAIIAGVGFLLKVVSEFIVFTPQMRIFAAFLAGVALIGGSLKLHKDNMKNYAEVLMGTGVAVIFVTLYCAVSLYKMIPIGAATMIGMILVIFTWFIAEKYKSFSTFLIGFAGGYLNPFFVNTNITQNFLLGYLIFLNLISIIYVQKNESKQPFNYINLFLTFFTVSIFAFLRGSTLNFYSPLGLWALYVLNDLVWGFKNKDNSKKNTFFTLNCINYVLLAAFTKLFNPDMFMATGLFVLGASVVYALMLTFVKTKENETVKEFSYGLVLSLLIGTYLTFEGTSRICIWAIEGAVIAYVASKYKYLSNWVLAFLLAAFSGIFFVKNAVFYADISTYVPFFNFRLLLFGIPVLCTLFASYILKENEKISDILRFMYVSLIYLFAVFEINSLYSKYSDKFAENVSVFKNLTYSIIGFIYAINAKRLALTTKSSMFSAAAGMIFFTGIVLLLFSSFSASSAGLLPILNLRFAAYIFAIGAGIYYSLRTKNIFYNYLVLILGFAALHFDVDCFTNGNALAISVTWILYSGLITLIGIFKNINYMKKAGIWVSLLAVVKITLFDLAHLEPQFKIITYITLGIILMTVSFFYNKFKDTSS